MRCVREGKRIVKNLFLREPPLREKNYVARTLANVHLQQRNPPMSKAIVIHFIIPLFLLFAWFGAEGGTVATQKPGSPNHENVSGTLQKMIVQNGSVTLNLDLNGLNGSNDLTSRPVTLQFATDANSFLPILVFNG